MGANAGIVDADPVVEVSVVIPVRDEADTIGELLSRLDAALSIRHPDHEVLVVDDGSSPGQLAAVTAAVKGFERARCLVLEAEEGQLAALVTGMRASRGSIVVTMDGDLQDRPEDVARLVAAVRAGSSVAKGCRRRANTSWWREIGSRSVTRLAGAMVGVSLSDFGGQFNAYSRDSIDLLLREWRQGMALIPLVCRLRLVIVEVPIDHDQRARGRSRYRLPDLLVVVADLVLDFAPSTWRFGNAAVVSAVAVTSVAATSVRRRAAVPALVALVGLLGLNAALLWRWRRIERRRAEVTMSLTPSIVFARTSVE